MCQEMARLQPKSKFRLSKKLFGCPIKPALRACPPRLRGGPYGRSSGGKWCKILHYGHILRHLLLGIDQPVQNFPLTIKPKIKIILIE
jgi:hypothetical protein